MYLFLLYVGLIGPKKYNAHFSKALITTYDLRGISLVEVGFSIL
jgi:hypothetical protein